MKKNKRLTNSTKAWLRLAPTLHLVFTILPKGLHSSMSSSSVHSHGRLRRWRTFEGVWVYLNWGVPEVDIEKNLLRPRFGKLGYFSLCAWMSRKSVEGFGLFNLCIYLFIFIQWTDLRLRCAYLSPFFARLRYHISG